MIGVEYERVAARAVPASQAGFTPGRGAPEQTLALRLMKEQAAAAQGTICVAYIDYSCFFMSIVRATCWAIECALSCRHAVCLLRRQVAWRRR